MNRIPATLLDVEAYDGISIVTFSAENAVMKMMALEISNALSRGSGVILGVKASSIALAKAPLGEISIVNQLNVTVDRITKGRLLCSLGIRFGDTILESVITLDSAKRMKIERGDALIALIKSSELSILEQR
jgi:molybdopterin-binding protein